MPKTKHMVINIFLGQKTQSNKITDSKSQLKPNVNIIAFP